MPIAVERAYARDATNLALLFDEYRQFYGKPSDLDAAQDFLRERLEKHESAVFFAGTLQQPHGFMQLYPSFSSISLKRMWILNDLYVPPARRGNGIGRALLLAAEAFARSQNAKGLVLQTAHSNLVAKSLYLSAGWHEDGEFATFEREL
jgi:GNAT superfamily N-acetyltransferase